MNKSLNLIFIGDISARPGRKVVADILPNLKKSKNADLVIANCENAAGGRGVTREILEELQQAGVDFFTAGEHIWDVKEFKRDLADKNLPIVRAYNYEASKFVPGKSWDVIDLGSKGRVVVAVFMGQTFMREGARSPFWAFDDFYSELEEKFGDDLKEIPIVIDFHAEATSEKIAFAWYVKDKVTAVLGTHTHVQTADERILDSDLGGCAFITDVGMNGILNAALWVKFDSVLNNYKYPFKEAFSAELEGEKEFNAVVVEIEKNFAKKIERIRKRVE